MGQTPQTRRKRVFLILRILLVGTGVLLAAVWISSGQRWRIFARIDPLIIAGTLAVFTVSQILIALRWWILLRTQHIHIPFWAAVRLYLLGWFYNNVMPSSVGGDLIRLWYVTKHTQKKFEAALSVLVDRVIGLISTLVIAAFFYTVFLRTEGKRIDFVASNGLLEALARHHRLLIWLGLLLPAALAVTAAFARGRALLAGLFGMVVAAAARLAGKLWNAAVLYGRCPLALLEAFGLTFLLQIMTITAFWFIGTDLGIQASIKYYYVFFTLVWVIGAIPISIGGAVVVELALAGLFVEFAGVEQTAAVALALCQRFVWILASIPGAVIHLSGTHLPKDFSVDCDEGPH